MIKKNNKERVIEEIKESKLENIFNIIPNLPDKILDFFQTKYNLVSVIKNTFEDKRKKESVIPAELFVMSGISARMKTIYSVSELPLALTSMEIIKDMGLNISYDPKEGLLKESNIRAFLKLYEEKKQDLEYNNYFINYANNCNQQLLEKSETSSNIHIYDCSVLDVNYNNPNYEGSSVTVKGNEKLRGYKIGLLRGVTPNGGVIEEIHMGTAKDHDFKLTSEAILNSKYLKPGDFLLEDRGFLDIDQFQQLSKKGINVIIPTKKNMGIYIQAVNEAKEKNEWIQHPNKKRKGQNICLIKDMEMAWLDEKNSMKKPANVNLDYSINCCVIQFDIEKNKDVLSDEEIITSDGKYAYAVILTNCTELSCSEIIRLYEQRSEIEEDFRQLKDFWGLNIFNSTEYNKISFNIMCSIIGYNLYNLFKETEEGQKYIGKNLIVETKHGLQIVKNVLTVIVTKHYFGMFSQSELLDLYVELDNKTRKMIKSFLSF